MSWTAPASAVAATLITSSFWNTYGRDNTLELRATPQHRANVYNNATQVVVSGNTNALTMNSEDEDTSTMHSTSSNTERVAVPSGGGGRYDIYAQTRAAVAGVATGTLRLAVNGSTTLLEDHSPNVAGVGTADAMLRCVVLGLTLAAADYVSMAGVASGGNVTFGSATAAQATRLMLRGPLPPS